MSYFWSCEKKEYVKRHARNGDKKTTEAKDKLFANLLVITCLSAVTLFVCLWMASNIMINQRVFTHETLEMADKELDVSLVQYQDLIGKYAAKYDLDPAFVTATVFVESSFRDSVESYAGAIGLMQITPLTGMWIAGEIGIKDYNVEMLLDPDVNVNMGCWYLSYLMNKFDGNSETVSAAYYAGPAKVEEWLADKEYSEDGKRLDIIPYDRTRVYVQRISTYYLIYRGVYADRPETG